MVDRPRVELVSPAAASANNGNWHTAARWAAHLREVAEVSVGERWSGRDADVLVALHARKSGPSIEAFRAAHPSARILLVMTGTDLYQDLPAGDAVARRSLDLADRVVVLQPLGLRALPPEAAAKGVVVVQSSDVLPRDAPSSRDDGRARFVALGHLREVKDPATLARAAARLSREGVAFEVLHLGDPLDPVLAGHLREVTRDMPAYRWLDGVPHDEALACLRSADALVHPSRLEGGANAVIEAVCAGVPVLASAVDGNLGLLGEDYLGAFPVGDDAALAASMRRVADDPGFVSRLRAQLDAIRPRFAPDAERVALRSAVLEWRSLA